MIRSIDYSAEDAAQEKAKTAVGRRCPICKGEHKGSMSSVIRVLSDHVAELQRKVRGLDPGRFDRSYGKGKWSIRQILCHLRDCELNFGVRWRQLISEERAAILPFDQDRWCTGTRYHRQDPKAALGAWKALREANVEMLKLSGKASWSRSGLHPEYGTISAEQLARHVVAHDLNHFGQIEKARSVHG